MPVLITGVAGFIGFHVARRLCEAGTEVLGIDNLNGYYSVELKRARLQQLSGFANFRFQPLDIANSVDLQQLFTGQAFSEVIHLAAQAGVRYSLDNPGAYGQANLVGFLNLLEACRQQPPRHLIYASSSSVYGANAKLPFSVDDPVEQPVSLYAASKRANELMAYSYAHLYRLPTTGLRFFTVYGPWGRPDMALFKFTRAMLEGRPIEIYNNGLMGRDFTYIDDIVESILRLRLKPPSLPTGNRPASCSTSAAASRCGCCISSSAWRTPWASRPSATTCHCKRETCWRPGPMWARWRAGSTSPRTHRWNTALTLSLAGTGIFTGFEPRTHNRPQVAS